MTNYSLPDWVIDPKQDSVTEELIHSGRCLFPTVSQPFLAVIPNKLELEFYRVVANTSQHHNLDFFNDLALLEDCHEGT